MRTAEREPDSHETSGDLGRIVFRLVIDRRVGVLIALLAGIFGVIALGTPTVQGGTVSNIRVTDVRDTAFVVSWTSSTSETGSVAYGPAMSGSCTGATLSSTANDKRGASYASSVHYVQVSGLDPNAGTKICIRVTSGASQEPSQLVTLGPTIGISSPDSVFGTVKNGTANAGDVIVYMTMTTNGVSSSTITTLVQSSDQGYYQISLSGARSG